MTIDNVLVTRSGHRGCDLATLLSPRLAFNTSIVTENTAEKSDNEGEYVRESEDDDKEHVLQVLQALLLTLMMVELSKAQKGGAKGAMRNKGGRSGGGGRGGGGGTRHMEEFEDSE